MAGWLADFRLLTGWLADGFRLSVAGWLADFKITARIALPLQFFEDGTFVVV